MKMYVSISLACLTGLLSFRISVCVDPVSCVWGSWGEWSECDGCSRTQARTRAMAVYSQFGGNPCGGEDTQTQPCETTRGCPLQDGCGERFACRSGKCISMSLKCNGDQDCEEDNQDELTCPPGQVFPVCHVHQPPPNVEHLGLGFDAVTGKRRGIVINTKSFGGQCSSTFSGDHRTPYRLPQSILKYNFEVKVRNDFSDEIFNSAWSYSKDIVKRGTATGTTSGHRNYDLHVINKKSQNKRLLVIKTNIEVAQFQSNAPRQLPLSEEFWKALSQLPTVYDYASYRTVLERFGTHYLTEGSLGGHFNAIVSIDEATAENSRKETYDMNECTRKKHYILFIPITRETCKKDFQYSYERTVGPSHENNIVRIKPEGGAIKHIAALEGMGLSDPLGNGKIFNDWAESVRTFPVVIKSKLAPLSELLKEVQCAGLKRIHLRRAIEQYLQQSHPCRCRPCRNNGLAVMDGRTCNCICKHGTGGLACESGTELEGQAGVIHGSWSCWSDWTSCSKGERRRARSCDNPAPQSGGQHCVGEPAERGTCDDDLEYLKSMEPQCFDVSLAKRETCGTPPPMSNGFVLDPRDIYLVGSTIEYTCIQGYHLIGDRMAECQADKTWTTPFRECKNSRCSFPPLDDDVTASVHKPSYDIGEKLVLSCPEGRRILGEAELICDSSLNWSPNPGNTHCSAALPAPSPTEDQGIQCKRWEKPTELKCDCIAPYQCPSSLAVCATTVERSRTDLMSVCKMHAMQCRGMTMKLAEDSACMWPNNAPTPCSKCQLWETCNEQSSACRCKDAAECVDPGSSVCVHVGDGATAQTMSECEAGLRRCKGEKVLVVGILPCEA